MPLDLKKRALQSYRFKLSQDDKLDFGILEAKKDLMKTITYYLKKYVSDGRSDISKLQILKAKAKTHYLLNLFFCMKLRKKYSPNFLKLILGFHIIELYVALLYFEQGREEKVEAILKKYIKDVSKDDLFELLRLCPNPSTIEIV